MTRFAQVARDWWQQPDQFDSVSALFDQLGLLRSTRILLATIAAGAGLIPLITLAISTRSTTPAAVASAISAAYVAVSVGSFVTRWPTRRQSAVLGAGGSVVITAWSVAQTDPTLQILACAVLALSGAYLAIFHNTKLMLFDFAISTVATAIAAVHTGHRSHEATAAAGFCVLWLLNVAVPLGAHALSRAMTRFAVDSYHDPLTGLLNRRGLTHWFANHITSAVTADESQLAVLLVDLDNFKSFNDTHGHSSGDRLLSEIAHLLRRECPIRAAICRSGGEEFFITYLTTHTGPPPIAPQLCECIAALPHGVTASIGTTTTQVHSLSHRPTLDSLIRAADTAMYAAKRNGGNQTIHDAANLTSRRP